MPSVNRPVCHLSGAAWQRLSNRETELDWLVIGLGRLRNPADQCTGVAVDLCRPACGLPPRTKSETDRGLYTEVRREHYKEASAGGVTWPVWMIR
jgi:hypothetical protein